MTAFWICYITQLEQLALRFFFWDITYNESLQIIHKMMLIFTSKNPHFSHLSIMTVTRPLQCLIQGLWIYGLQFFWGGIMVSWLLCCSQVPFWCHFKAVWARGGLAWLDQLHFCAPFHVWHSISPLDKQSEQGPAPSTNYRSPCQQRGALPTYKPMADIVKGEDWSLGDARGANIQTIHLNKHWRWSMCTFITVAQLVSTWGLTFFFLYGWLEIIYYYTILSGSHIHSYFSHQL